MEVLAAGRCVRANVLCAWVIGSCILRLLCSSILETPDGLLGCMGHMLRKFQRSSVLTFFDSYVLRFLRSLILEIFCFCILLFLCSKIYIAPLQGNYSEALPTPVRTKR